MGEIADAPNFFTCEVEGKYNGQWTMDNVQFTRYNGQGARYKGQFTMYNGQWTRYEVRGIRLRQAYAETGKVSGEPDSVVGKA